MSAAIRAVIERRHLTAAEMTKVMGLIMGGHATPAQIGGFLVGLRMKGETVEEITAAASVMRHLATPVHLKGDHVLDTCGTGGDGAHTFNISTAVAFVAAAGGAQVAKHGNRSVSSRSGSADVLEAAGIYLDLTPEQLVRCIAETGVGFMFAPRHHGAMKHAVGPRREMGVRTLFNLLGPLTNPAGASHQLIGVFAEEWLEPLAQVLRRLGSRHVLVVHAADGLDELSLSAPTAVAELRDNVVHRYTVTPEQFGLARASLETLVATSAQESLAIILRVLEGQLGPARDIVVLNSAAALYAADLVPDMATGITRAQALLDSGAARERFTTLVRFTNRFRA